MWDQGVGSRCSGIWSLTPISFSGCFLAGHSWVLGGREFPKPTIWVSPSRVVALGGSVTIRCEGRYPGMEFFLRKAEHPNRQVWMVPDGTVAEFPIASVGWEDGGSYTCGYRSITDQSRWSYPSDPVEIIVGGTLEPSSAPDVTRAIIAGVSVAAVGLLPLLLIFLCYRRKGPAPRQSSRFGVLKIPAHEDPVYASNNEGKEPQTLEPDPGTYAELDLQTLQPSVYAVINVSQGVPQVPYLRLGGAGDRGVGGSGEGSLPDPVMASALTVLFLGCWFAGQSGLSGEGSYPKPSISVSPSGVIPMGGNVTIQCWHQRLGMRILLYKAGNETQLTYTDPAGSEAEFPITSARREHGGSYSCRYSNRTGPAAYSEPSDPVQIIVAELSYPKPSISLRPSGGVAPGGAVTIRCRGSQQNVRFHLGKYGNPTTLQDAKPAAGNVAEFLICNVSQGDGGSYSCYYQHKSDPATWSHPSDPVELVVAVGNDQTQPAKTLAPTCPGSTGPGTRAGSTKSPSTPTETGGTDPTQMGTTPASTHPSSPGPDTSTGGRNSPSTTRDTGRTDTTQSGTTPASTRPGSARPGGSEASAAPVLTRTIIAGVSAAAAVLLLLLLLLAFVCYRRTRGRKGPAPRQSRESEAAATVYALMAEGKQMDVLPQETDPGAEGLTYAKLDGQVLQAKRGGPAPAPEPVLYATINVSQGPDG
ncbi:leukocyte immunoglobulin-like receptor subfamily B member 1 [Chrysemys picta bellii]|uniref:leukocyte immunoglobulin-like receptor subfamily B member 1 n=1 Tax=Chrysemys picta bellii TaxID=8478 RepID=UPI0032B11784